MKIKLYEDFEWDDEDFDEEEFPPFDFKVGDRIRFISNTAYWNSEESNPPRFNIYPVQNGMSAAYKIKKIQHASEITGDGDNKIPKGSIPYDGYMVILGGMWPWFKIDNMVKA